MATSKIRRSSDQLINHALTKLAEHTRKEAEQAFVEAREDIDHTYRQTAIQIADDIVSLIPS